MSTIVLAMYSVSSVLTAMTIVGVPLVVRYPFRPLIVIGSTWRPTRLVRTAPCSIVTLKVVHHESTGRKSPSAHVLWGFEFDEA